MRTEQRIVTQIPLTELWDSSGVLELHRGNAVSSERLIDLLRTGPVQFVLAKGASSLKWIPMSDCYRFWKEEVKPHLVEPLVSENGFRIEDWPDNYCYLGTEWMPRNLHPVVLLETYH
jgi:hypothetical protein